MRRFPGLLSVIAAIAVVMLAVNGTAAAKVSPSTYCVAIDVDAENAEALAEQFDAFAQKAALVIDASHPLMRIYYSAGNQVRYPSDSRAIVALTQMGPLGWIVSYTQLREGAPPDLLVMLQQFVGDVIAESYRVTPCEEIEGFTPPVIYH